MTTWRKFIEFVSGRILKLERVMNSIRWLHSKRIRSALCNPNRQGSHNAWKQRPFLLSIMETLVENVLSYFSSSKSISIRTCNRLLWFIFRVLIITVYGAIERGYCSTSRPSHTTWIQQGYAPSSQGNSQNYHALPWRCQKCQRPLPLHCDSVSNIFLHHTKIPNNYQ